MSAGLGSDLKPRFYGDFSLAGVLFNLLKVPPIYVTLMKEPGVARPFLSEREENLRCSTSCKT